MSPADATGDRVSDRSVFATLAASAAAVAACIALVAAPAAVAEPAASYPGTPQSLPTSRS